VSDYDSLPFSFLALPPEYSSFEKSRVVILPVAYKSTAPSEIVSASRNVERYDEELQKEVYKIGIHTLPILENADAMMEAIYKASCQILQSGKFLVALGGEHSITFALVKANLEKWPSMAVLQVDANADLLIEQCPVVHVGMREEIQSSPKSKRKIFFMKDLENDPGWFVKVVDELPEHVYLTMHIDPSLSWKNLIDLTRELTHRRNIVGFDVVNGIEGQAFLCAKLVYKILGYVFR
jgi:agmatinase